MAELSLPFDIREMEEEAPRKAFGEAMDDMGFHVNPVQDGRIHRFKVSPSDKGKAGWYVYYPEGVAVWADWHDGEVHKHYDGKSPAEWTSADRAMLEQKLKEAERQRLEEQRQAADWCVAYYTGLAACPESNAYLMLKGVHPAEGLREDEAGNLVIPVYGILDGKAGIISLQTIAAGPDGKSEKRFHKGGKMAGGHFIIGKEAPDMFLAEGIATALSIYEATGISTVCAFNAGNLKAVSEMFPKARLTVVADNDESRTGETKAEETGRKVILIPEPGMDANDYAQRYGLDALKALLVPSPAWLVPGDSLLKADGGVSWYIRKTIQKGANIMLFGAANIGKSFMVIDQMLTMSAGLGDWHGLRAKKAGCVYLCGEGMAGLGNRLNAWLRIHGRTSTGKLYVSKGALALDRPDDLRRAIAEMALLPWKPEVIFIETLAWFIAGDENKAQDSSLFLQAFSQFREAFGQDLSVVLVTHSGVANEDRARGSSVFRGAMDTEMKLWRNPDGIIVLEQTKQKELEIQPPMRFALEDVPLYPDPDPDAGGEIISSAVISFLGTGAPCRDAPENKGTTAKGKTAQPSPMDELIGCWIKAGTTLDEEGRPVLSKDQIKQGLLAKNMTKSEVERWMRKEKARPLQKLADCGRVSWGEDGRVTILDEADISAALLQRRKNG